jgi:cytoskeletal protein CcmA (bactofilin family)
LAKDLVFEGDLTSSHSIEVEGKIKGNLKGNSVILREGSFFEGTIIAQFLNIRGNFQGSISAKNITIASKAKISGLIEYESLLVEDGASIEGQFKPLNSSQS